MSFTYGGNGATYSTDFWFAPEFNLFVQSKGSLGPVDGFDQNEGASESDERAVVLFGFLAPERDPLEAF